MAGAMARKVCHPDGSHHVLLTRYEEAVLTIIAVWCLDREQAGPQFTLPAGVFGYVNTWIAACLTGHATRTDQARVSRAVRRLVEYGYVEKVPDPRPKTAYRALVLHPEKL